MIARPKMHADEFDLGEALVHDLLAEQFPEYSELPLERVPNEGTDNAIFRLGDGLAVRLPRRPGGADAPAREHELLTRLGPHLSLPTPRPVALGRPGRGYPNPWAIHSWLEGEAAEGEIPGAGPTLAELISELQQLDTTGAPPALRGRPLATNDAFVERLLSCAEFFDVDRALAVWEEALAAPAWDRPPVWLHSDVDPRNLLVADGRIVAVLDFGSAGIGDPAFDFAAAFKVLPAEEREEFRAALDVDDATWLRGRGWIVQQCVMALPYYTLENNPTLVREASRWMREVI